jgi:hypothetical protein
MKKLMTICLVCVLTTAAWGAPVSNITISFDENGNGNVDGTTLVWSTGIPIGAGTSDQYATLYYELPGMVVVGDLVLYEPTGQVSDVLRFVNNYSPDAGYQGRVYVYSDPPEQGDLPPYDLADTGIPYDFLYWRAGMDEQGTENGWNGIVYTPQYIPDLQQYLPGYMMQYGESGVTYNFTSDVPEPATICILGLGALSLIRRKK